jgi:hypothetical protein
VIRVTIAGNYKSREQARREQGAKSGEPPEIRGVTGVFTV